MKKTVIKAMAAASLLAATGAISPMNAQSVCISSVAVITNNDPTITFSVDPGCGVIGACCTHQYYWNFGDGNYTVTVGTNTVSHTYNSSGNYNVYAYPSDTCWCSGQGAPNTYTVSFTNVTITNASFTCSAYLSITTDSTAGPGNYNYSYSFSPNNATPVSFNWIVGNATYSTTATGSSPVFYLAPGSYSVCLDILLSNGSQTCSAFVCTTISDSVNNISLYKTGTTDITSNYYKINAIIYPYPSKDVLNIKLNNILNENVTIQINDLSGRLIKFQSLIWNEEEKKIDISELQSGTYILKINTSKGLVNQLWIKE